MARPLKGRIAPGTGLGIVALLLAAAGGTYAAARSGGVISVCVHHRGGGLYRAGRCARHDRKLSWNATGRRGPVGRTGPSGATGPAGPLLSTLPSGRTETGTFYAAAYADTIPTFASASISFPILASSTARTPG